MPKVVVSLLTEEQEFQRMQAADARSAAARLGLDVDVVFAENNAVLQIQQLFQRVHAPPDERPAALVVESVAGDGLERVARNAARAEIGWVLLNWSLAYLEALRKDHPGILMSSVAADEEEIGRIQARQLRALLPAGGHVVCVQGPADTPAAQGRMRGLEAGIQGSGIEVRSSLHGDWTEAGGERAISQWLRLKTSEAFRPEAIVCQNDAMAVGARRAVRALRKEWTEVPHLGCDGLPDGGRKLVEVGELAATVIKPTTTGRAVELVAAALGGSPAPPSLVLHPTPWPSEEELVKRRNDAR